MTGVTKVCQDSRFEVRITEFLRDADRLPVAGSTGFRAGMARTGRISFDARRTLDRLLSQ
jgi:hypothetical protein